MISRTKGIVLHTVNFSETSVIAKVYTETYGMQSYMLNGVRKSKSKFKANLLQPLSLVELIAHQKENRDLQRVSDIIASPLLINIPYDVAKSSLAFFIAEVLYKSIREEEANKNLFAFLVNHIQLLDHSETSCKQFHHYFLMQLTKHLGFFPNGDCNDAFFVFDMREGVYLTALPPYPEFINSQQAILLHQITNSDFENHHQIEMSGEARRELLNNILHYYELHALHGAKINSHKVLEEVLG
ncbi:MAG: DNA repair protein RecO [Bacteroidia bacterium]